MAASKSVTVYGRGN